MMKLSRLLWLIAFGVASGAVLHAQTLTTLVSFDGSNGQYPDYPASLPVQGVNGNFYGATASGGAYGEGTVFEMSPAGQLTTLYNFCSLANCADGAIPVGKLVLANNGNFYGTTSSGGAQQLGTVFQITPTGKLKTLHQFCAQPGCPDGSNPAAGLVQGSDGNFYGTTNTGGRLGGGTVFKITPSGLLTTLVQFGGTNGKNPAFGSLIQASDGNFYGTTQEGGSYDYGTVFRVTPTGKLTVLYSFCSQSNCTDGSGPYGGVVQGANGKFYGAAAGGGANADGTIFQITSSGNFKTLHSFDYSDGYFPEASLIRATDGNLYGTTPSGGSNLGGTVFEITPAGAFSTLYYFCSQPSCADGSGGFAGVMQATNGEFYGPAFSGGANNEGTIYSLATGLGPFVETLPAAAKVGANVMILGNQLKGTTNVTFNGTAAIYKVVSNTEINATVPAGATSGAVQVLSPSGTLTSNVKFRVLP